MEQLTIALRQRARHCSCSSESKKDTFLSWVGVFVARCSASAAYVVMRCLSVRVSVTFVHSIKMNKDIFEFFSPSGSQAILVFPHQTA